MGHARAVLALDSDAQIKEARDAIIKGNLTVREAEGLVKRLKAGARAGAKAKSADVHSADLVEQLQRRLMTRVVIRRGGRGGKIEIAFGNQEELSRIVDMLIA